MCFGFNIILQTVLFNMYNAETKWQILYGCNRRNRTIELNVSQRLLKSHLSCLTIYIYFVVNLAQFSGKKNN